MDGDLRFIGVVRSELTDRADAPKQGREGAPSAWLEFDKEVAEGLKDVAPGDRMIVLTWLDRGDREVLAVHPRDDLTQPLRGVFSTRSSDRPNPIGLHLVEVLAVDGLKVQVDAMEAIDGTPIVDLKPVIHGVPDA